MLENPKQRIDSESENMHKNHYLKKVIFILREACGRAHFEVLSERLRQIGLVSEFSTCTEWRAAGCENKSHSEKLMDIIKKEEGTLYITDSAEQAHFFNQNSLPVLGWLHADGDTLSGLSYLMERPEELEAEYLERVYRRFMNIPWDILETKRCIIRETTVMDVDTFYEIYSNPEIIRYMEDLYPEKEQEQAYIQEYIEKVYQYFEFGVWTVLWKETGEIIGRAGFSVREGYDLPELGFVIAVPWQGKGVATEVCSAILKYGEEEFGFEKVQTLAETENAASLALCRSLGFEEEQEVFENGKKYLLLIRTPRLENME